MLGLTKFWTSLRLHVQLALAGSLLLAVTILLGAWFGVRSQTRQLVEHAEREAVSFAKNLSTVSQYLLITDKLDELESLLLEAASFPNIESIRVVGVDGLLLSHVEKRASGEVVAVFDLTPVEPPSVDQGRSQVEVDWDQRRLAVWQAIETATMLGWVEVRFSLQEVELLQRRTVVTNSLGAVSAIVLDVLALLGLLYVPARTFRKAVAFAGRITERPGAELDLRGGSREIDELISALNSSSSSLASQADELQERAHTLERLNETLETRVRDRTEALERFTYSVSHDLKSPLVTIAGFIGLLENDIASGKVEQTTKDLARIRAGANEMQELLDDLLRWSQTRHIDPARDHVCTGDLVRGVLEMLAERIRSTGAKISVVEDLPDLRVQGARFKEVYLNLVDNALKYRSNDRPLEVAIGFHRDTGNDGETTYFVKDNGVGVDPAYQSRIFALFEQVDSAHEGTGAGLAIVKQVIEDHGGRIWVESEGLEKGATFCFALPNTRLAED